MSLFAAAVKGEPEAGGGRRAREHGDSRYRLPSCTLVAGDGLPHLAKPVRCMHSLPYISADHAMRHIHHQCCGSYPCTYPPFLPHSPLLSSLQDALLAYLTSLPSIVSRRCGCNLGWVAIRLMNANGIGNIHKVGALLLRSVCVAVWTTIHRYAAKGGGRCAHGAEWYYRLDARGVQLEGRGWSGVRWACAHVGWHPG